MAEQTVVVRPPVWALLAAVVVGGLFYLGGKRIEARHRADTPSAITVTGEGRISAAPDIAELSFGVRVDRARTAKEAMDRLSREMTAVVAAVRGAGVPDKDVSTEQLSLTPSYDWTGNRQVLAGYDASQSLRVKVRDLGNTSAVLGAATSAGANQAGDVRFTLDDPDLVRDRAREQAIIEARKKADILAKQLHVTLGELTGYAEDAPGAVPPLMYARGMATAESDAAQAGTPLPAGEQDVTVRVSLTYGLAD